MDRKNPVGDPAEHAPVQFPTIMRPNVMAALIELGFRFEQEEGPHTDKEEYRRIHGHLHKDPGSWPEGWRFDVQGHLGEDMIPFMDACGQLRGWVFWDGGKVGVWELTLYHRYYVTKTTLPNDPRMDVYCFVDRLRGPVFVGTIHEEDDRAAAAKELETWINSNFPNMKSLTAYWDD